MKEEMVKYIKLKFKIENIFLDLIIFYCFWLFGSEPQNQKQIFIGMSLIVFPLFLILQDNITKEMRIVPISNMELKKFRKIYIYLKFFIWISFGILSYLSEKLFGISRIGFLIIFIFLYILYGTLKSLTN